MRIGSDMEIEMKIVSKILLLIIANIVAFFFAALTGTVMHHPEVFMPYKSIFSLIEIQKILLFFSIVNVGFSKLIMENLPEARTTIHSFMNIFNGFYLVYFSLFFWTIFPSKQLIVILIFFLGIFSLMQNWRLFFQKNHNKKAPT